MARRNPILEQEERRRTLVTNVRSWVQHFNTRIGVASNLSGYLLWSATPDDRVVEQARDLVVKHGGHYIADTLRALKALEQLTGAAVVIAPEDEAWLRTLLDGLGKDGAR